MRAIDRGLPYVYVMAIGMDVSADSFEASIRAAPDAAGAALADFDVTVGAFADGVTTITLALSDTQTDALPSDGDAAGLAAMVFDMLWTPTRGSQQRFLAGVIQVSGKELGRASCRDRVVRFGSCSIRAGSVK